MAKKESDPDKVAIIVILAIVVISASIAGYIQYRKDSARAEIGRMVCSEKNLTFESVSGEFVRCFRLDASTAIKQQYQYLLDWDRAKVMYAKK